MGAGSGPSRWARHARIAAATSATARGSSTGTIACSWRANTSTLVSVRNEQMVSTWPVDNRPSVHAAPVTGSWVTSRATRVMTAARGRAIRPRSVIHAVIEVAPTVSHNDGGVHGPHRGGDAGIEPVAEGQHRGQVAVIDR